MIQQVMDIVEAEEMITADEFDDAMIGIDFNNMRVIYSVKKCIDILCEHTDREDAEDFFEFNYKQAYFGDRTPIWCEDNF